MPVTERRPRITVSGLFVYPLKSARGVPVDRVELDERGPRGDRRWMLVDDDNRFLTLRTVPRLALVDAALVEDGLCLGAPGAGAITVTPPVADAGAWIEVTVWGDSCRVLPAGAWASRWCADVLGISCRLVHLPDGADGPAAARYGSFGDRPRRIALTDGAPLLLTNEASLANLNARLDSPVPMRRFRPNVIVDAQVAFAEDAWHRITIGDVAFDVVNGCPRCVATTVDTETAEKGVEPLRTLATFRKQGSEVFFGQNVAHRERGVLRVGEVVRVDA